MTASSIEVGNIYEGKVVSIKDFGAFVELPGGKIGLVHISEIDKEYVKDIRDYLKEKEKVKVKVLSIDKEGRVDLSIKQAKFINKGGRERLSGKREPDLTFEEKLSKFMKESEERLLDLKRNIEAKRGGRKKR